MNRWLLLVVGLGAALVGAGASLAIDGTAELPPERPVDRVPVPAAPDGLLLVWTSGGLPGGLAATVVGLPDVTGLTEVQGGTVDLVGGADADGKPVLDPSVPAGWSIVLDAIAVDPATLSGFAPRSATTVLQRLRPGEAVLGATSARLRRTSPGATLEVAGGRRLTVVGVVDDQAVGAAEVVLHRADAGAYGIGVGRYLLVRYRGARRALEEAVRAALPSDRPVRFRAPGETPFLRDGDAVLPQALVKERFGEFASKRTADRDLVQDPAWIEANIVTAEVPLLGRVSCHRAFLPTFAGALAELEAEGLGYLVDRVGFAGCWAPRLVETGGPLSRHAWGAAVDLNVTKNPVGTGSAQDPRLVAIMRRWGLTFGGSWLQPDPAHFEYLRPPTGGRTAA